MTGCRGDGPEKSGAGSGELARIALGPVTKNMALEMAALTRDYHPWRVTTKDVTQSGEPRLLLHEVWISGLAAAHLPTIAPGLSLTALKLMYRLPTQQGEVLTLRIMRVHAGAREGAKIVVFEVLDRSRKIVADGTARLEDRSQGKE